MYCHYNHQKMSFIQMVLHFHCLPSPCHVMSVPIASQSPVSLSHLPLPLSLRCSPPPPPLSPTFSPIVYYSPSPTFSSCLSFPAASPTFSIPPHPPILPSPRYHSPLLPLSPLSEVNDLLTNPQDPQSVAGGVGADTGVPPGYMGQRSP